MGKESGKNCLFKVTTDEGVSYTAIEGQKDTQWSGSANPVDTSDKTSDGWGSTIAGTKAATVTMSGVCNWGSDTAFQALRVAWENSEVVSGRAVFNSAGNNYEGDWSVTQFDVGGTHDGATEYNITVSNAGPLTYAAAED